MPQEAEAEENPLAAFTPPAIRFMFLDIEEFTGMKRIKEMAKKLM